MPNFHFHSLLPSLVITLALPLASAMPATPEPFSLVQTWAGPHAASRDFTREKVSAFLAARAKDLATARQASWSDWLKGLEGSPNPSLHAWALARRVAPCPRG